MNPADIALAVFAAVIVIAVVWAVRDTRRYEAGRAASRALRDTRELPVGRYRLP